MQKLDLPKQRQKVTGRRVLSDNDMNRSPSRVISLAKLADSELNTDSVLYTSQEKENVSESLRLLLDEHRLANTTKASSLYGLSPSANESTTDISFLGNITNRIKNNEDFKLYKGKKNYLDTIRSHDQYLKPKHSKLDLLDDTKLTSFPLPHPQPTFSQHYASTYEDSETSQGSLSNTSADNINENAYSPFEEFHQLVLIEDYVQAPKSLRKNKNTSNHKVSIIDLKRALANEGIQSEREIKSIYASMIQTDTYSKSKQNYASFLPIDTANSTTSRSSQMAAPVTATLMDTIATGTTVGSSSLNSHLRKHLLEFNSLGSLITSKRNVSPNSDIECGKTVFNGSTTSSTNYGTEAYLDKIVNKGTNGPHYGALSINNATSSLKYCIMCEKPLYDISSLIPLERRFEEIVCSNCFEEYERVSNALSDIPADLLQQRLETLEDAIDGMLSFQEDDVDNTTMMDDDADILDVDSTLPLDLNDSVNRIVHSTNSVYDNLIHRLRSIQNRDALLISRSIEDRGKKIILNLNVNSQKVLLKTYRVIQIFKRMMFDRR